MHDGLPRAMGTSGADFRDDYVQGSGYYRGSQYNEVPNDPAMFSGSPPTPRSATEIEDGICRTRSGRTIMPSSSPMVEEKPRLKATPKSRKTKVGKSEKAKMPKLTAPLSLLTKDMNSIPIRNMEEWVNRSADVRRKEVEKRNGYVTRPMNSFMLYRSAYAERTKQWCLQNNHQIVSSVSGESWPMEPPEVRELYNEYAKIERINHQNAHPTYRFSPSKAGAPARKRKGDFSDAEPSDLDDAEWNPGHSRSRPRPSKRLDRSSAYSLNDMNAEFFDRQYGGSSGGGVSRSVWEMTNEGRPMPMPVDQGDLYNQYYQTAVHLHMGMNQGAMDDMRMRRADTPITAMQFSADHALLGLPGGNATTDLLQQLHSHDVTPLGGEPQVDPMLLAFDGSHHHDVVVATGHPDFRNGHMAILDRELDQHSVDSFIGAAQGHEEYRTESWQPDPSMPMEQESEFEKWMGE
ncbi:hypothetical protein N0V90_006494 [Kalmusia sp. IMI 367209]|nr:hypothetical protein N0V90_006494 [Kalmusia sp. IMI 367209]